MERSPKELEDYIDQKKLFKINKYSNMKLIFSLIEYFFDKILLLIILFLSLIPLYYNFFSKLGFNVVISENSLKEGEDTSLSSFCYPMLLSHGFFQDLLNKKPD